MLTTSTNPYHHNHHHAQQCQIERTSIHEIPFWIGNEKQRRVLVSGIKKMTTCQDVIRNLLPSFSQQDPKTTFFIVEKWRKMERKLEPNELILQVWNGWGDERDKVNFILKESTQHPCSTTTSPSPIDDLIHRKVHRKHKKRRRKSLFQEGNLSKGAESLEGLLYLVLQQRETIQVQLTKLRHKEKRIEEYEDKVHQLRRVQHGNDYVFDAIQNLQNSPKSKSKMVSVNLPEWPGIPENQNLTSDQGGLPLDLSELPDKDGGDDKGTFANSLTALRLEAELILKICSLNKKLKKEEYRLVKLGAKIEGIRKMSPCSTSPLPPGGSGGIEEVQIELNAIREITQVQDEEIQKNEESLSELDLVLKAKQEHLAQLASDLQFADSQSQILQQQLTDLQIRPEETESRVTCYIKPPTNLKSTTIRIKIQEEVSVVQGNYGADLESTIPESVIFTGKENCGDNDSNSDTGISSLHSSRDENSPLLPLDTLV